MRYSKKEKQLLNEGTCSDHRRRHTLINSDKLWRMIPDGSIIHEVGEKTAAQIYVNVLCGATAGAIIDHQVWKEFISRQKDAIIGGLKLDLSSDDGIPKMVAPNMLKQVNAIRGRTVDADPSYGIGNVKQELNVPYGATVGDAILKTVPLRYLKQVYEARERTVDADPAHFTHTSSNLTLRKHENNMFTQVSLTEINKHN